MRTATLLFLLAAAALASGCASPRMYSWGSYDTSLYGYYRNAEARQRFEETLEEIIREGETRGNAVPPGVYAEFGYLRFEEGNLEEAVLFFRKESERWPESRVLMDKLIRNAARATRGNGPADAPGTPPGPDSR